MIDTARSYCHGKDGILLQEMAYEIKASFLSHKSEQTTRWVRSLLSMIEAFYRNLPTICKMIGSLISAALKEGDLTEQKCLQQTLDFISNPFYLAFGIGVAQILDSFSKMSLNAQKLWNFPGTVVKCLEELKQKLHQNFSWEKDPLFLAGIGSPLLHIENLEKGILKQQLTDGMRRAAAKSLNLMQQRDYDFESDENDTVSASEIEEQEIGLVALTVEEKNKIECVLSNLCKTLKEGLETRITVSPLMKGLIECFHHTDWYDSNSTECVSMVEEKIKNLSVLVASEEFEVEKIIDGYTLFLDFKVSYTSKSVEDIYQLFFQSHCQNEKITYFINFFEFLNIKSYSEAYRESVGSLMNILVNKGRNLSAGNFSKELIFAFNAPSIHVLSKEFISEIAEDIVNNKRKEFFRKIDSSEYRQNRLKFDSLSAALGNLRAKSDESAHLPISFFN